MSTRKLLEAVILASEGRFLTITFRKNDGTVRTINGRFGVTWKGQKAEVVSTTKDKTKTYYRIWSSADRGFRMVNADSIMMVSVDGLVMFNKGEAFREGDAA